MIEKIINSKDMNVGQNGFYTQLSGKTPCAYHSHTYYEIFYVYEGQICHYANGTQTLLSFGDLIILRPSDKHRFLDYKQYDGMKRDLVYKKSQFVKACNYISPYLLDKINAQYNPVHVRLSPQDVNMIENFISEIQNALSSDVATSSALVNILLITILQKYIESTLPAATAYPQWIQQLISDMNNVQYFYNPIDVYIDKTSYSKSYVARTFKKYLGISINEFYLNTRLTYAKTLLTTTNKNIEEIAKLCGFNNRTYFHRIFLKKYGNTPSYIRKHK